MFPKIVGFHPISNRVFHYFHHPFWGTPNFLETSIYLDTPGPNQPKGGVWFRGIRCEIIFAAWMPQEWDTRLSSRKFLPAFNQKWWVTKMKKNRLGLSPPIFFIRSDKTKLAIQLSKLANRKTGRHFNAERFRPRCLTPTPQRSTWTKSKP